jgi:uncharacterized membrane protein
MATVEKAITIDAPPERVFEYFDEPTNLLEIWPSMVDITDVKRMPNGGAQYHWAYKLLGLRFEGDTETVAFERDRHVVEKNTGQIPSTFDWEFRPADGGTEVSLKVEYEIPSKLLGRFSEPFIVKLNDREAETVLANLKDRLEH